MRTAAFTTTSSALLDLGATLPPRRTPDINDVRLPELLGPVNPAEPIPLRLPARFVAVVRKKEAIASSHHSDRNSKNSACRIRYRANHSFQRGGLGGTRTRNQ